MQKLRKKISLLVFFSLCLLMCSCYSSEPEARHYGEGYNFLVARDSVTLMEQQPEEHLSRMPVDSFGVRHGQRVVVAELRTLPVDSQDSVWVQVATEDARFGWVLEHRLLSKVVPADPISQFIMFFSDVHLMLSLALGVLVAAGYLLLRRRKTFVVHFHDIPSFYPSLLVLVVSASAAFYASIQQFAPDAWQQFYFHPTLNPFSAPPLLALFLFAVWALPVVALAAVSDTWRCLQPADAILYLGSLFAVCAVAYIVFSLSTLVFVGYPLLVAYCVFSVYVYFTRSRAKFACGKCGTPLPRHTAVCPHCGTQNVGGINS